jgi:hypothetical protein
LKPKREQAHVTQDEEEASLLLMKSSSTISSTSLVDVVPRGVEQRQGGSMAVAMGSDVKIEI